VTSSASFILAAPEKKGMLGTVTIRSGEDDLEEAGEDDLEEAGEDDLEEDAEDDLEDSNWNPLTRS
jgi:hypothetical protein